jgi:hypothetical protein
MKKELLFLCIAIAAIEMQSQNAIPNPDFELWTTNSIENPMYFPFTSNENCYKQGNPSNVKKVTPAYHGQYALELKTLSNNLAFMMNADSKGGNTNLWTNGMAYTGRPTGIRGYYKYNLATTDSALIVVMFRKSGTAIGTYQYKLGGIKSDFTLLDYSFTPALTQDPDSLIFGLASSDYYKNQNGVVGSTLTIDSISLKGVASQPLQFNGDYELWEQLHFTPILNDWNLQSKESGLYKSSDAKTGQYALKLITYLGEENNVPRAQPGNLTSGYRDNTCDCIKGGLPYTKTKDTLAFWYKYSPQGNDFAQVSIHFMKNGSQIHGEHKTLNASQNYQYIEVPFNLGVAPDHVIVQAISSDWQNKNTSYVGSTLLLDNMVFKSTTNTSNQDIDAKKIAVWPNMIAEQLKITNFTTEVRSIEMYNIAGNKVLSAALLSNSIDVSMLPKGVYFVRINTSTEKLNFKIIKI